MSHNFWHKFAGKTRTIIIFSSQIITCIILHFFCLHSGVVHRRALLCYLVRAIESAHAVFISSKKQKRLQNNNRIPRKNARACIMNAYFIIIRRAWAFHWSKHFAINAIEKCTIYVRIRPYIYIVQKLITFYSEL